MADQNSRAWMFDKVLIPIFGAVIGAVIATWFQASTFDKAQIQDVIAVIKDPGMNPAQKLRALEIYREITDRPWSLVRSLLSSASVFVPMFVMALLYRGRFDK